MTPLNSALAKLDEGTAQTVHLTPQEAAAVLAYIRRHGISGEFVANSVMMLPKGKRPGLRPVQVWPVEERRQ